MPGPGRPREIRSEENAELICRLIVEGFTLRQIARELGCDNSAICHWRAEDEAFSQRYARAKEAQADTLADELLDIADDGQNDWMKRELESGSIVEIPDHEHIQRSRVRVDTRKWLMSKMAPRRYGDRVEHVGAGGGPIMVRTGVIRATEDGGS